MKAETISAISASAGELLVSLGENTKHGNGIWRAAYTGEYMTGKNMVKGWMEELGFSVREDAVGNLFGRIEGKSRDTVMAGSHLDTVINGGCYDGAAGVLLSMLAIHELVKEHGQPEKSIEAAALIEEEGSRFSSSYIGSRAITGNLTEMDLLERDQDGISLGDAMADAGYSPEKISSAYRDDVSAFLELHIEQGPVLERLGMDIGVVQSIVGIYGYNITITGQQNHAGTTPMDIRLDPVTELAALITDMNGYVRSVSSTATVTVGSIETLPGLANVIPGSVNFTVEFRDGVGGRLEDIDRKLAELCERARSRGYGVTCDGNCHEEPAVLNKELVDAVENAAIRCGCSYHRMNSGAGHDCQIMSQRIPAAMIFVPSKDGISHSPIEFTGEAQLAAGKRVLKEALLSLIYKGEKT